MQLANHLVNPLCQTGKGSFNIPARINYTLFSTLSLLGVKFDPAQFVQHILDWETLYAEHGIWPNYVLGNHDAKRIGTRHTKDEDDARLKV